jgi:glycosyltransferase involved in cell wall biosynthesis
VTLDRLAGTYDQSAPDRDAGSIVRGLAGDERLLVGYLGKLIPQKGVERMIEAVARQGSQIRGVVVGFGTFREWLEALVAVLDAGDVEGYAWLREASPMHLELDDEQVRAAAGLGARIAFTGRLDHRYAPGILAALAVQMVPSTLAEAFGMVAAEGAAAGALPLVARHSGLAEVAATLEDETARPGSFSFEPGDGATRRASDKLSALLTLPAEERARLRTQLSAFVSREWSWEATARRLLAAVDSAR